MNQLSGASTGWAKITCFRVENPWAYTPIACGFLLEPDHFGSNAALSPNWVQSLGSDFEFTNISRSSHAGLKMYDQVFLSTYVTTIINT